MQYASLEVQKLVKTFPGAAEPVLRGVTLTVAQREVFGIIGPSGAGKSTLVRCLDLLETPTTGVVRIAGQDASSLKGAALRDARRRLGVVFQHFNLLASRSAFDNVALPLEIAGWSKEVIRARVGEMLELVGLATKRDRYPSEMSGGEKQRVGIARALAARPSVLLCDEATSALDPETTEQILDLLDDIHRELGLTIVLVTHEMDVVKRACDRVAVLDAGRVVEEGAVYEVFTAPVHEVTRKLVLGRFDKELAREVGIRASETSTAPVSRLLRVASARAAMDLAVLGEATWRFGISLRIVSGSVERIRGARYGRLVVEAEGEARAIDEAVNALCASGLDVEALTGEAERGFAVA